NAPEILSIDGIDAALLGPSDLAANLGCPGDFSATAYTDALARVELAARRCGKILGSTPHGIYSLDTLFARGHRLFVLGADTALIRRAVSNELAKARSCFS